MTRSSSDLRSGPAHDGDRLVRLVAHLNDAVVLLDASGRVLWASPSAERATGLASEELLEVDLLARLEPLDDGFRGNGSGPGRSSSGRPHTFGASLRHADGSLRRFEVTVTDLLDDPAIESVLVQLYDVTDRFEWEQALEAQDRRFRSVINNSTDITALVDEEARITFISPAVEAILGYEPAAMLGMTGPEFLHPDSMGEAFDTLQTILDAPGERISRTFLCLHADGSHRWLDIDFSNRLRDPDVGGLIVNARDVTDRKRAEERLRETELRYRSMVENVPAVMYLAEFGPHGRWHYASPYIEHLLGYSSEEWLADPTLWYESLHPEDRDRVVAEDERASNDVDSDFFEMEYRMLRRDGQEVWVRDEFRIARGDEGEPLFMRGVILDITHRKEADTALREKDERIRSIFDHSPLGIGLVDLEGHTIETNEVLRKMLGYSEEEFAALTFDQYTSADDITANELLFDELARGDSDSFRLQKRFIHKDGRTIWANIVVSLIRDEAGRPAYALGMTEDITERKALEDQLRQAQKMEAVGRLAGGVAHDFNNLLAVIINCADFLFESVDRADPRYQDIVDISEAGRRGADLVRQLLAFSRKDIVRPEIVDLNIIVSGMNTLLGRTLGEDIELDTALSTMPCIIEVDTGQVEQILVNLAVNSRDAMPDGGRILITTDIVEHSSDLFTIEQDGMPESYVRLTFTDTGMGMSEDVQKRIFEPFFTTKSRGRGTGLGLATAYGAVRQAGGYISVRSEPGTGTTFTIYLPRAERGAPSETAGATPRDRASGDAKVLLVEDDDSLRRLARRMLERNGYEVTEAADPEAAYAKYRVERGSIDVVLTDVIMPGSSGKELCTRVRDLDAGARFLFMSGYPEDVIADHGVLDEGYPFLGKPFTEQSLVEALRSVLEIV